MMDFYALWIGRIVMVGAGGIAALLFTLLIWCFALLYARAVWKKLIRVYTLTAVGYWLERLEETGWYAMRKEVDAAKAKGPGPGPGRATASLEPKP